VRIGSRLVDQVELTGHGVRPADLDLLSWLGVEAVRYPLLWGRSLPDPRGAPDWRWSDDRLSALRRRGIRPILGLLHHGGEPVGIALGDPGYAEAFASYAGQVARRYPWVDTYIPVNEPLTTARFAGLYGLWHPHARSESVFSSLLLQQCIAIRAAMEAIRDVRPDARLIVNEDLGRTDCTPPLSEAATHLNERRWLTWDLLMGLVDRSHAMWPILARSDETVAMLGDLLDRPCPPDVIGIDHYVTSDRFLDHRLDAFPAHLQPAAGGPPYVDVEAVRVHGAAMGGVAGAIDEAWARYQVAWWRQAWAAACDASRCGVPVEGVTAWAVVGASGWDRLLCSPRPKYEPGYFDARRDPPRPRPAAFAVRSTVGGIPGAVVAAEDGAAPGWWLRDDRFVWQGREIA
jgi:dTDP-4-dehydrorhamnose reductase